MVSRIVVTRLRCMCTCIQTRGSLNDRHADGHTDRYRDRARMKARAKVRANVRDKRQRYTLPRAHKHKFTTSDESRLQLPPCDATYMHAHACGGMVMVSVNNC